MKLKLKTSGKIYQHENTKRELRLLKAFFCFGKIPIEAI